MSDLVERMRGFESDHTPDGWPAVRMREISGLCDEITALRAELAEAKKDAERLDFLDSLPLRTDPSLRKCNLLNSVMHFSNNRVVIDLRNRIGRAIRTGYGNSAREAIDAAIAGEKK